MPTVHPQMIINEGCGPDKRHRQSRLRGRGDLGCRSFGMQRSGEDLPAVIDPAAILSLTSCASEAFVGSGPADRSTRDGATDRFRRTAKHRHMRTSDPGPIPSIERAHSQDKPTQHSICPMTVWSAIRTDRATAIDDRCRSGPSAGW